jgi:hypothetical protein
VTFEHRHPHVLVVRGGVAVATGRVGGGGFVVGGGADRLDHDERIDDVQQAVACDDVGVDASNKSRWARE